MMAVFLALTKAFSITVTAITPAAATITAAVIIHVIALITAGAITVETADVINAVVIIIAAAAIRATEFVVSAISSKLYIKAGG